MRALLLITVIQLARYIVRFTHLIKDKLRITLKRGLYSVKMAKNE